MIGRLSRREHIMIGAALVIALLTVGWQVGVQRILDYNHAVAELLPARAQVLEGRRQLVARKATIGGELEAADARLQALSARLLTAATPAVAASELQRTVKELAAQEGTEVRSERILPAVERGELLEVPIEIAVSGEIRHLTDLLARFEAAPKLLVLQNLRVRVVNVSQPRELLATLTLSGFILTGKAKA